MAKRTKAEIMKGIECVSSKVVANNTVHYVKENGDSVYRLHDTDIITYKTNGDLILDSGGWQTVTTKERMNRFVPGVNIYQEKSIWYLHYNGEVYIYQDGITLKADGSVQGAGNKKEIDKLKKDIKKYVDDYCKKLFAKKLPKPGPGDCFFCQLMIDTVTGKPIKDNSHIKSHIKESYFVPSLIVNAMNEMGASTAINEILAYYFGYREKSVFEGEYFKKDIKRMFSRYLKRELGLPY